jgi:hypothetical protein
LMAHASLIHWLRKLILISPGFPGGLVEIMMGVMRCALTTGGGYSRIYHN